MGEAEAEKLRVQAAAARYAVDAEGQRAVNEAANTMSPANVEMQVKMALMKALPDIIRESVKPMENIDGIKILQVNGLNGAANNVAHNGNGSNGNGSLADDMVNSALRYRAQA